MSNLTELKNKLSALTVFRELLEDAPLLKLYKFLHTPTLSGYAEFVSELYKANDGNISAYIRKLCENSENVYVKAVGAKNIIPKHIKDALLYDLETLQMVAELTPDELTTAVDYNGYLPEFAKEDINLTELYLKRCKKIEKYGYGIYAKNHMFYIDGDGKIIPVSNPDTIRLSDLVEYERERQIIIENTMALLSGKAAANILLTGDAGTGKSSSIKAVGNELHKEGLRIIEIRKDQLRSIPKVLDELSQNPLKFILFIDDLSFLKDDDNFNALKAVLEGSVTAKSKNVAIYATSNRRHIIKETFSDREGDDVHRNDTMQELISLSERFGLHITFSKPNKDTYLKIVHHLAEENGLNMNLNELDLLAERFALERGNRSARLARQFVDKLLSEKGDNNVL